MPARGGESEATTVASVESPAVSTTGDDDEAVASRGRWGRWRRPTIRPEIVGLVAVVIMFIGGAGSYALQVTPFYGTDERAHLGYSHEIADGNLPEIDTRPDVPDEATLWRAAFENETRGDDYRTVWVANHPPLHYVLTAPLMWVSDLEGRADGGLMYMRFANIIFASAGIVFTYLLTTELTGGVRRLGLAAATIVALLPRGQYEFSQALNDGLAFAGATATIWAGIRLLRRGPSRNGLMLLAGTVAAASATRAATMLLAFAVVGVVAFVELIRHRESVRERLRAAFRVLAWGVGPTLVIVGWFYARIWALYGDIGASSYLLERFDRSYQGSPLEIFMRWDLWKFIFQALPIRSMISVPIGSPATTVVNAAVLLAVIGMGIVVWTRRTGDTNPHGQQGVVDRRTLCLGVVSVLTIMATLAQHVSGGGAQSTRYVFPVLAVLAAFIVMGLDRVLPRLLPLIAIVVLAVWSAPYKPGNVASDVQDAAGWSVGLTAVGTVFTVGFTLLGLLVVVAVLARDAIGPYLPRRVGVGAGTDSSVS